MRVASRVDALSLATRWLLQNSTDEMGPATAASEAVTPSAANSPTHADLIDPHEGVWAPAWDVIFCVLPIALLVVTTVWKRVRLDTSTSLPLAAGLMWIIRLAYLKLDTNFTNAAVIYGLFDASKPLAVVTGAICLFQAMEVTKCLPWMMSKVRSLSSGHPVAEVFLISWAFAYMIEGASGFGTPVALSAPMLVSLGHPPIESVTCCLIMNTLATVYGAVGFPLWFGLDGLPGVDSDDIKKVGFRAQVMLLVCAHVIPVIAASFLVRLQDLKASWLFVLLSIWSAKAPALVISYLSTDFSSLIGGMIAVVLVGCLAHFHVGLNAKPGHKFGGSGPPKVRASGTLGDPDMPPNGDPSMRSAITHRSLSSGILYTQDLPQSQVTRESNTPPMSGADSGYPTGVDGDSIGPSASEYEARAEGGSATSTNNQSQGERQSHMTASSNPSRATKSFNNARNPGAYTYRVAPRAGQAHTYSRDSVHSYSSSNAAGSNAPANTYMQVDTHADSLNSGPGSPQMRDPRHRRRSPGPPIGRTRGASPPRGTARPAVSPWGGQSGSSGVSGTSGWPSGSSGVSQSIGMGGARAQSITSSGGHARVVSGPLPPFREEDELNMTEESTGGGGSQMGRSGGWGGAAVGKTGGSKSGQIGGGGGGGGDGDGTRGGVNASSPVAARTPGALAASPHAGVGGGRLSDERSPKGGRHWAQELLRAGGEHPRAIAESTDFDALSARAGHATQMCTPCIDVDVDAVCSLQTEASGGDGGCGGGMGGRGRCRGSGGGAGRAGTAVAESGHAPDAGTVFTDPRIERRGQMMPPMGISDTGYVATGGSVDGQSVSSTEAGSISLGLKAAPVLGARRQVGLRPNARQNQPPSQRSTAPSQIRADSLDSESRSGIMFTRGTASSVTAEGAPGGGGGVGKRKGDAKDDDVDLSDLDPDWGPVKVAILRTLPLWLTVVVLLLTRIEPIGLRDPLNDAEPNFDIHFGLLFKFELSRTIVFRISEFLGEELVWKFEFLYIPFFLPFVVVSAVTVAIFRRSMPRGMPFYFPLMEAFRRTSRIALALFGSLVLVSLIRNAESPGASPAYIIGYNLSDGMGKGFIAIAGALGALGSFFSGSTTVSNLTFGIVHVTAARSVGLTTTALLALQSVGATAGNMICINNIISARTVVGGEALRATEGSYILKTAPALGVMLVLATLVALPFLLV